MPDQATKLKAILEIVKDSVGKEEFQNSFKVLIDFVKKLKELTAQELEAIKVMLKSATAKMESDQTSEMDKSKKEMMDYCMREMRTLMAEHKSRLTELDNKMASIRDGKDADPQEVAVLSAKIVAGELLPKIMDKEAINKILSEQGDLIADTVSGLLEIKDIKDLQDELDKLRKMKTNNMMGGLRPSPTGVETPVGDINSVNKAYTVNYVPQFITLQGQIMYADNGYALTSVAGVLTITLDDAPITGNILKNHY